MSLHSVKPVAILLIIVASMATTFSPVQSQFQFPPDTSQCWQSIRNAQVCFEEIDQFLHGQCGGISVPCCDAVEEIGKNCLAKLLPFNPFFPPLLESFCAGAGGVAPAPAEMGGSNSGAKSGFLDFSY
ncbi:hypothetical protein U1Q18_028228 [Sarracenia purpurea var. burkii]